MKTSRIPAKAGPTRRQTRPSSEKPVFPLSPTSRLSLIDKKIIGHLAAAQERNATLEQSLLSAIRWINAGFALQRQDETDETERELMERLALRFQNTKELLVSNAIRCLADREYENAEYLLCRRLGELCFRKKPPSTVRFRIHLFKDAPLPAACDGTDTRQRKARKMNCHHQGANSNARYHR